MPPELLANNNNPQAGAPVPQTFMDINLNTTPDWDAVSGYVFISLFQFALSASVVVWLFANQLCFTVRSGNSPTAKPSARWLDLFV